MSRLRGKLSRRHAGEDRRGGGSGGDELPPIEEIGRAKAAAGGQATPEILDALRQHLARAASRAQSRHHEEPRVERDAEPFFLPDEDGELPGQAVETPDGEAWLVRSEHEAAHGHGRMPVGRFLECGEGIATLAQVSRLASIDPLGVVFLDTETTGLAGGTGTLPFLIGLAWFEPDGRLIVEQVFLREPAEEPAGLHLVADRLSRARTLMTFNGRSFDAPLLNTRFVLNRTINPAALVPHVDLLHVARRVFGRRLPDRSLGSLERVVLGFHRQGDVPGSLIPGLYTDFLRGGTAGPMLAVLDHNHLDLVALAALAARLEELWTDPEAVRHAQDSLGLAASGFVAGARDLADRHLRRAQEGDGTTRRDALALAARQAEKRRLFDRARDLWLELLAAEPDDAFAHLALAKHFEHREKDVERALRHARKSAEAEGEAASAHRVARLEAGGRMRRRRRPSDSAKEEPT